jgi:hypothetical protein
MNLLKRKKSYKKIKIKSLDPMGIQTFSLPVGLILYFFFFVGRAEIFDTVNYQP